MTPDPRDLEPMNGLGQGCAVVIAACLAAWAVALTVAGIRWLLT